MSAHTVLIRHGEAFKNLESRHGGQGTSLSVRGRDDVRAAAAQLQSAGIAPNRIQYVDRVQCRESAEILARHFGVPLIRLMSPEPFSLGILDGLSDEEVRSRYPHLGAAMDRYRAGLSELIEVEIPGATNVQHFYATGVAFINEHRDDPGTIIVGTRSVLILLASVLLRRLPQRGGGYREILWPNSRYLVFEWRDRDRPVLSAELSSNDVVLYGQDP